MDTKPYFFVRDDDAGERDASFNAFYKCMAELEISVIYSVIPSRTTPEFAAFMNKEQEKGNILLAQHGWTHANHGVSKKYEFGHTRTYAQQKHDIERGLNAMNEHFRRHAKMFVPPFHHCNAETLQVLRELNFDAVSTGLPHTNVKGMLNLPALISFEVFQKDGVKRKRYENLMDEFMKQAHTQRVFGIYTHHQGMTEQDLRELKKFLEALQSKVQWITSLQDMKKAVKIYKES